MIHHPESLGAFRWATVRLYCPDCHRFAQFSKAGLIMRFGAEIHGHTLLNRLLPCDRRTGGVGAVALMRSPVSFPIVLVAVLLTVTSI